MSTCVRRLSAKIRCSLSVSSIVELPVAFSPGGRTWPEKRTDRGVGNLPVRRQLQRGLRAHRCAHDYIHLRNGVAAEPAHRRLPRIDVLAVARIRAGVAVVEVHDDVAAILDAASRLRPRETKRPFRIRALTVKLTPL